jgi:4-hydroxy-2-oxoheptanedioate aldolase
MREYPPNTFKQRLAERTQQLGYWLALNSPAATEIAAGGGFDWVLLDMEHSLVGIESVERHLLAARHGGDAEFMVRVPGLDAILVKRLLDCGVRSLLFPFVQTVEEARLAVAATRYPPAGIRGTAGNHRANRYSRDADYFATAHEDICVVIQIESPKAVAAIPGFGAIEGLDGMFIGPNDLSASMGMIGQLRHPDVIAAIDGARDAMLATGKAAGILDFDPQSAGKRLAQGFGFIAVGGDGNTLVKSMAPMLEAVRTAAKA